MFYVGQKVVCVDTGVINGKSAPTLTEGRHYTVGSVFNRGMWVEVVEALPLPGHLGFWARRFRPLTDISQFHAMLTHQPLFKPAREDA